MGQVVAATVAGRGAQRLRADQTYVSATLLASAAKSTSSNAPLIADTLRSQGRAPDHGHIAFHATQDPITSEARVPCLGTEPGSIGVITFDEVQVTHRENRSNPQPGDPAPSQARTSRVDLLGEQRPRRLTPREWERLQGFPDDWTLVDGASDAKRYEAIGNSMATPVLRWIGRRLVTVDRLARERDAQQHRSQT